MINPLLVIGGTTASGKNDLAEQIAGKIPCQLISADSIQIYKKFDIGSSKPSPRSLQQYNYHLIDLLEPHQIYSAGNFAKNAEQIIVKSWNRKNLPIVIGGTGFYIRALLQGLADFSYSNNRKLHHIKIDHAQISNIYNILSKVDPKWAGKINPNDRQRILRAWEVVLCSGYPMSTFISKKKGILNRYKVDLYYWILNFPKSKTNSRIERRTETMLQNGLLDEVKALFENGIDPNCPAMKSVGYRQVADYFLEKISKEDLYKKIVEATKQYAKRQRTWFKKEPGLRLTGITDANLNMEKLFQKVGRWADKN